MLARFQFDGDRFLALSVVEVLFVGGDDFTGCDEVGVDEDVEMSCAFVDFTGWFDDKAGCGHNDLEGRVDGCAVSGLCKADRRCCIAFFDDDGDGVTVLVAFQSCVKAVCEL